MFAACVGILTVAVGLLKFGTERVDTGAGKIIAAAAEERDRVRADLESERARHITEVADLERRYLAELERVTGERDRYLARLLEAGDDPPGGP